jgi:CMP-N,N'-diacetyllegionaminic acid synthase
MRSLGVIHARGGSKRVPRKNIKLLNGYPLIAYMVRASLASKIDRVIVSTDDNEIAEIARKFGAEVPFMRPAELSEDVPSEQVTCHALEWAEADENSDYEVVVTLQPTTPFIEPAHINECLGKLLRNPKIASCFTAVRVTEPPQWMFTIEDDTQIAKTFMQGNISGERGVFQTLPPLYFPNGGAYATRVSALREQNLLITNPATIVPVSHEKSVDIDEPIDWIIAESIGSLNGFKPLPI